jgi:hypothetical protein
VACLEDVRCYEVSEEGAIGGWVFEKGFLLRWTRCLGLTCKSNAGVIMFVVVVVLVLTGLAGKVDVAVTVGVALRVSAGW